MWRPAMALVKYACLVCHFENLLTAFDFHKLPQCYPCANRLRFELIRTSKMGAYDGCQLLLAGPWCSITESWKLWAVGIKKYSLSTSCVSKKQPFPFPYFYCPKDEKWWNLSRATPECRRHHEHDHLRSCTHCPKWASVQTIHGLFTGKRRKIHCIAGFVEECTRI